MSTRTALRSFVRWSSSSAPRSAGAIKGPSKPKSIDDSTSALDCESQTRFFSDKVLQIRVDIDD